MSTDILRFYVVAEVVRDPLSGQHWNCLHQWRCGHFSCQRRQSQRRHSRRHCQRQECSHCRRHRRMQLAQLLRGRRSPASPWPRCRMICWRRLRRERNLLFSSVLQQRSKQIETRSIICLKSRQKTASLFHSGRQTAFDLLPVERPLYSGRKTAGTHQQPHSCKYV